MDKKNKNMLNDLKSEQSVTLKTFLISYCGIYNETLFKSKLCHEDIKFLLPDLKRVSYDYVMKNIEQVYTGKIILVKDSYNHLAPYINPKLEECYDIEIDDCAEEFSNNDSNFDKVIDVENLNLYELNELRKKYKSDKRFNEYRRVCKIIKTRKASKEIYNNKKQKILKRRDNDDKY